MPQGDHLIGQQTHRPAIPALRRFRTGQRDQVRFGGPVQFANSVGAFVAVFKHVFKAAFHQTLTKPFRRSRDAIERLGDLSIRPARSCRALVQFQQHLSVQTFMSRHPLGTNNVLQYLSFFLNL